MSLFKDNPHNLLFFSACRFGQYVPIPLQLLYYILYTISVSSGFSNYKMPTMATTLGFCLNDMFITNTKSPMVSCKDRYQSVFMAISQVGYTTAKRSIVCGKTVIKNDYRQNTVMTLKTINS